MRSTSASVAAWLVTTTVVMAATSARQDASPRIRRVCFMIRRSVGPLRARSLPLNDSPPGLRLLVSAAKYAQRFSDVCFGVHREGHPAGPGNSVFRQAAAGGARL